MPDRDEIPTATPMFSGSRNSMVLLRIPSDVSGSRKSKLADVKPDALITSAILDFRLPLTSDGIRNSTIEFLDPKNMGVAVGILSLSGTEPEIRWGVFLPPPPLA